jgi:prevent-host-death family protein
MRDTYSLYEAKARLSALVRQVREGHRVIITVHGRPAVELRPVEPEAADWGSRLAQLEDRGVLVRRAAATPSLPPLARRPGALRRFLDERD